MTVLDTIEYAIAKRCCVSEAVATLGASAQITLQKETRKRCIPKKGYRSPTHPSPYQSSSPNTNAQKPSSADSLIALPGSVEVGK